MAKLKLRSYMYFLRDIWALPMRYFPLGSDMLALPTFNVTSVYMI